MPLPNLGIGFGYRKPRLKNLIAGENIELKGILSVSLHVSGQVEISNEDAEVISFPSNFDLTPPSGLINYIKITCVSGSVKIVYWVDSSGANIIV